MKTFSSAYRNSKQELNEAKTRFIDDQHRQILNAVKREFCINSFSTLSESERLSYRSMILEMWNPTTGLTDKGIAFINEGKLALTPESTADMVESYAKKSMRQLSSDFASGKISSDAVSVRLREIKNGIVETGAKVSTTDLKNWFKELVAVDINKVISHIKL